QRRTALDREQKLAAALERAARASSTEAAVAALGEAVHIDPENTEVRRQLETRQADLVREQEEARRARERAAAVASALEAARAARSHEEAMAALRTALGVEPDHLQAKRLYAEHESALNAERERARKVAELVATAQGSPAHEQAIAALGEALTL